MVFKEFIRFEKIKDEKRERKVSSWKVECLQGSKIAERKTKEAKLEEKDAYLKKADTATL